MWQRFTERARRVVLLGQEAAGKMNSGHVGTEHLLLGLVSENEGVSAQVLQNMGITLDKVRTEIQQEVQPDKDSDSSEPKLTPKAKHTLELAADEARRMRHNYIGTEHLLLALLREKDGLAATVLRRLGLNLEVARAQVMEYLGPDNPTHSSVTHSSVEPAPPIDLGNRTPPSSQPAMPTIPVDAAAVFDSFFTPEAMALINRAAFESNIANQKLIGVEHLLLALLSIENAALLRSKIAEK